MRIRGFGGNATDELVVQAIVGIPKGMGKKTVAECVTDEAMVERLRRGGVDYAQGFHVGAPRPVRENVRARDLRLNVRDAGPFHVCCARFDTFALLPNTQTAGECRYS